jgi:hypothetical protein
LSFRATPFKHDRMHSPTKQPLSVRLEPEVREALHRVARQERRTLSSAVNHLLARELFMRGELRTEAVR